MPRRAGICRMMGARAGSSSSGASSRSQGCRRPSKRRHVQGQVRRVNGRAPSTRRSPIARSANHLAPIPRGRKYWRAPYNHALLRGALRLRRLPVGEPGSRHAPHPRGVVATALANLPFVKGGREMSAVPNPACDFVVTDLGLADWGRKEISHRRDRDARPDRDPRRVHQPAAAARRAHHRLAAHDDPDRRADRNACRRLALRCAGPRATSIRRRTTRPPPSPPPARRCSPRRANRWRSTGITPTGSSSGRTAATAT